MAEAEIPTEDHEALVNWARRQQRLTASISEFAVAITSIRDDGSALQQLVSRTRTLLDVDMAYISLNGTDGSGFTHIVETDGVFTEEYRNLRMPLGAGVLGRVAQAGGPVQTVSYEGDDLIVHDSEVDRIVAAEGVEAILGAPMRSGGRVVGALMAANRYRHRFTAEQVSLAQTLANLAAVAIENSTRLEQLTMSVQSLRSRSVEAERQLQIERRLTSADEALMDAIVTGGEPRRTARRHELGDRPRREARRPDRALRPPRRRGRDRRRRAAALRALGPHRLADAAPARRRHERRRHGRRARA